MEGADGEAEKKVEFDNVLLLVDGDKVKIGEPQIKGARVAGKVLGQEKGRKLRVFKYKAKSRYRRTKGHRSQFTRVKIDKISTSK